MNHIRGTNTVSFSVLGPDEQAMRTALVDLHAQGLKNKRTVFDDVRAVSQRAARMSYVFELHAEDFDQVVRDMRSRLLEGSVELLLFFGHSSLVGLKQRQPFIDVLQPVRAVGHQRFPLSTDDRCA